MSYLHALAGCPQSDKKQCRYCDHAEGKHGEVVVSTANPAPQHSARQAGHAQQKLSDLGR